MSDRAITLAFVGSYSVLTIGRVQLQWKYRIPPFLSFLFEDEDFYSDLPEKLEVSWEDASEDAHRVGYRTTAGAAQERLDDLGFTLPFFASTYQLLDDEIDDWVLYVVGERLAEEADYPENREAIDDLAREHVRSFPRGTPLDDIHKFIGFIRDVLDDDAHPAVIKLGPEIALNLEDFSYQIDQSTLRLDPGVLRIGQLVSESSFEDYPEVVWLLLLRLLLEVTPQTDEVHLDLWDLWEGQDFSNQPAELAEELSRKVRIYNHVFAVLSKNEADIRWRATRSKIRSILGDLPLVTDHDSKGRLLEGLVATIFESHPDFVVAERRYNVGDQEIDLVIQNHLREGFWRSLESPLILVECKNWDRPVGPKEIRDFETKVRDHQPHARIAFFVAPGGFTRFVDDALLRASREPYQLVLVRMSDIEDLVVSRQNVVDWLAGLTSAVR